MHHLRIEFATSFTWLFQLCFAMRGCSTRLHCLDTFVPADALIEPIQFALMPLCLPMP